MRHSLATCALAAGMASPAFADADRIEEVVVTAARRTATSDEISSAVSIVKQDDVLAEKLVTDALATQIGVFLQQTTPGQGAPIIRGLKGSAILQLVDGMPLSNAIMRSAPTPYLALVPTVALDHIEIIRGTPASLYGSQAVGGVIQVISYVPSFDSDTTTTQRELAIDFDTAELRKSIKASIDVGDKHLAASLAGEYLTTGDRRTGGGERIAPSGYTAKGARFVLNATPSDTKAWLVDLHWLEQPGTPRIDELIPGYGQTEPSSSEYVFAPSRRLFAHAEYVQDSGWLGLDWRLDAGWQRIDDDRASRPYESTTRRFETNSSDLAALSLNASGRTATISWIIGTDMHSDEIRSARFDVDIDSLLSIEVAPRFPDGSRVDQLALFGNVSWHVSDRDVINTGLRITDVSIDFADIDISRLSGDIGWVRSFNDTWQMAANAGFGFRAPNIFDLGTFGNRPGNRFNIPNAYLKEETVQQLDIGVRRFGDTHHVELMVYTLQFDNRITSVLTGDSTPDGRDIVQSVNAASTDIHGAEMGIDVDLSANTRLRAVLNYTWGEESIGTEPRGAADRIPPLSGTLSIQTLRGDDWSLEGWFTYAGRQDRLSERDVQDNRINPAGTAGWAMLGASATWTPNDVWVIELTADNLLDKRYRIHGSGMDAPGRNFGLSFRVTW